MKHLVYTSGTLAESARVTRSARQGASSYMLLALLFVTSSIACFSQAPVRQASTKETETLEVTKATPNGELRTKYQADRQTIRIERTHARRKERQSKYIRRIGKGEVKYYFFDFISKQYVCDDEKPGCDPPYAIHEMDGVGIKIYNVNPLLYDINLYELQGDQISNENLSENNSKRNIRLNVEPLSPITLNSNQLLIPLNSALENKILERDIILNKLKRLPVVETDLMNGQLDDELRKQYQAEIKELQNLTSSLVSLNKSIDGLTLKEDGVRRFEKMLRDSLNQLQTHLIQLNAFTSAHNAILYLMYSNNKKHDEINRIMKDVLQKLVYVNSQADLNMAYINTVNQIQRTILACTNLLTDLYSLNEYMESQNDNGEYKSREVIYADIQTRLSALKTEMDKKITNNPLVDNINYMINAMSNAHFTVDYITARIQENADYLRYRIEFNPAALPSDIPSNASPFVYELGLYIHEGFKVDVSSGFVLDVGLKDPTYYFDRTTDVSGAKVYVRENTNSGNVTPSLAVFLNGYKRTSTNFKVGGAAGFGLSNNARFRLYIGPACIIGRKERIVITGGVALGAVSRLADGYNVGKELENSPSLPNEVPTLVDKFTFGGFFGLGFNLTGKANKSFTEMIKFR